MDNSHLILDPACIFKEGFLTKSPPLSENTLIRKQWRMRWFVLYDTKAMADLNPEVEREVCLIYYKEEKDKKAGRKPKGKITLDGVDVSKYRGKLHGNDFVINIQTQKRLYHICSAQPFSYDQWFDKIREHYIPNETETERYSVPILNDTSGDSSRGNKLSSPAYSRSFDQCTPKRPLDYPDGRAFDTCGRKGTRFSLPFNVMQGARPRTNSNTVYGICTPPRSPRGVPETNVEDSEYDDYIGVDVYSDRNSKVSTQVKRVHSEKALNTNYVQMNKYKCPINYRTVKQRSFDVPYPSPVGIGEEPASEYITMKCADNPPSDDTDPDYMRMGDIIAPHDESHPDPDYVGMDGIVPPDESQPVYIGMDGMHVANKNYNTARRHKDISSDDTDSDYTVMGTDPLRLKNDIARRRLICSEKQGITNLDSDTDSGIGRTDSESSNTSNLTSRSSISSSCRSKSNSFDSLPGFVGPRLSTSSGDNRRLNQLVEESCDCTPNNKHNFDSRNVTMRTEKRNNKNTGERLTKCRSFVELRTLSLTEADDTRLHQNRGTATTDEIPHWEGTVINFEHKF